MHIALGDIAAARVEREFAVRRGQVLQRAQLHDAVGIAEAMLDQAYRHCAAEVLVNLHDIDVLGSDFRHFVQTRRERPEMRGCIVG